MDVNSGKLKIYYPTADRERAKKNRDAYKPFLLDYMESTLKHSPKGHSKYQFICPFCNSGEGKNKTGAFSFDVKNNRYCCFACMTRGDIYDLMQKVDPLQAPDTIGAFLLAERLYKGKELATGQTQGNRPTPQENGQGNAQEATETAWQREFTIYSSCPAWQSKEGRAYLSGRGFTEETIQRANLLHNTDNGRNIIIIPYEGDTSYFYNSRDIRPEASIRYYKHGKQTALYNQKALYTHGKGFVFVTEGELDALSIIEAGGQAIATGSASNADFLIKVLEANPTEKHLILCFDTDQAGNSALSKATAGLSSQGIAFSIFDIGKQYKDANALLASDGGKERLKEQIHKAIEQAQQPQTTPIHETPTQDTYTIQKQPSQAEKASKGIIEHPSESNPTPYNTLKYLQSGFRADIDEFRRYRALSTGFASLDDAIGGGIFPGLYILGAVPGRGKTTFMLQLASQFAKQGEQVLFFSIEETALALTSKIISREASNDNRNEALQAKDIMKGYTNDTVNKGRKAFEKYANNLHIIPCNHGATAELIKGHVDQFINHNPGKKPIVIVDYLQALISNSKRSLREITDENTQILKQAQANHNLIFFIVSSFNRGNYTLTADFTSFKESGGIDYTGTNIWALELAVLTNDDFLDLSDNQVSKKREQIERAENTTTGIIQMRLKCLKSKYSSAFIYKLAFDGAHDRFFGDPSNFIIKD